MTRIILVAGLASVLLFSGLLYDNAFAAVDMFMNIKGVDGEAKDKDHKKWIELESFNFGIRSFEGATGGGGGSPTGTPSIQDIEVTKFMDTASAELIRSACCGPVFDEVIIDFVDTEREPATYLRYTMKNVQVTSYSVSGAGCGGCDQTVSETVAINFQKLKSEYHQESSEGGVITEISFENLPAPDDPPPEGLLDTIQHELAHSLEISEGLPDELPVEEEIAKQSAELIRQIIKNYQDTAKNIIQSIGR